MNQLIGIIGGFFAFIVALRFLLQVSKADFYNPISQGVYKITQPLTSPIQKVMPRIFGIDFSALILALLVIMATIFLLAGFSNPVGVVLASLLDSQLGLLSVILNVYFFAIMGAVIISWVAPNSYHPGPQLIAQLTDPLFSLARKVIPPLGGLDFSPMVILLLIVFLRSQLPHMLAY
ncbi:YggT family protein [Motiliproteus sp. MSK22-1]|uniref:YggT family protein n=1 Tax=Motiliproteus sp. MSK22-1 TaxID=1897630 RepID=UPI001E3C8B99|nr:YggT family protein [Motiliproteus sp. MSK22-1]